MKTVAQILLVFATLLPFGPYALSATPSELSDQAALYGLQEAKGVFMIDLTDPKRFAHVLKVIEETQTGIAKQGVKPHLIVVVIGPTVAFLTQDRRGIPYLDQPAVARAQATVAKLKSQGVRIEACGIALKGMDIKPSDLIPQVTAVGNGFISAIGYQTQGYQLVPVY